MPDISEIRRQFPITERCVFLNHAAAGPIPIGAVEAMHAHARDHAENGVRNHAEWSRYYQRLRERLAVLVGGRPGGIAFVQNTSSGISLAANGIDWRPGDNVVLPACEFPSNYYPWTNLAHLGVELRRVEAPAGHASTESIAQAVDARTRAVAISFVQYSNGCRNDLEGVGRLCRAHQMLFVVDGTQGVGAIRLDVERLGIDLLAVSAHKWMLGPLGIGFVHCSERALAALRVPVVGWLSVREAFRFDYELDLPEDAARFEPGTENAVGLRGLGGTLELMETLGFEWIEQRVLALTNRLVERLRSLNCEVMGPRNAERRSGIVVFRSPHHATETLHERLSGENVVCSVRNGGIRLSPHYYNNESELDFVCGLIARAPGRTGADNP